MMRARSPLKKEDDARFNSSIIFFKKLGMVGTVKAKLAIVSFKFCRKIHSHDSDSSMGLFNSAKSYYATRKNRVPTSLQK